MGIIYIVIILFVLLCILFHVEQLLNSCGILFFVRQKLAIIKRVQYRAYIPLTIQFNIFFFFVVFNNNPDNSALLAAEIIKRKYI